MPRLGQNLEDYFSKQHEQLSSASIRDLGCAIVSMLEAVHKAGFTYNDLKLDNLMVEFDNKLPKKGTPDHESAFANATINLVDFGFAAKYVDKNKVHMPKEELDSFKGNLIFASLNQLNFFSTSRRDDMVALCYLLVYVTNNGKLPGIDMEANLDKIESFHASKEAKSKHTIMTLCAGRAECLRDFATEIFKMKYQDKPDYAKLKTILT